MQGIAEYAQAPESHCGVPLGAEGQLHKERNLRVSQVS